MMDRYGRKVTLGTPLIPIIVLWILTATATSRTVLFVARVFLGIFGGFGPPICQVISRFFLNLKMNSNARTFSFRCRFIWLNVRIRIYVE